jgi:hypothetical protein
VNPVTVDMLNRAEKYRRSKQVEACQRLNQAQAEPSSRPSLIERAYTLGALLRKGRSTAEKRRAPSDTQVLGHATE